MDVVGSLAGSVQRRTPHGVATAMSRLIRTGYYPPGSRLPTVREVAAQLRMSPTVISEAWTLLARAGVIRTEGRRGTFVTSDSLEPAPPRLWQASREVGSFARDLSTGTPDTALLPSLNAALARLSDTATVSNYLEPAVLPSLERMLRAGWADVFEPEAVTVVDGAMDALDRICREYVHFGDRVIVEDPALPTIFDVVESYGGVPVGVPLDEEGLEPEALAAALRGPEPPVLVVLQPRAQNPTGVSMSGARARELAEVLGGSGVLVAEDDHSGAVAWSPLVSLAPHLPLSTLHITSFSKSHGPDLRLAAVAGPLPLIQQLGVRRRLGPSWSSRLLQTLLLELLLDPVSTAAVEHARREYHRRRDDLVDALASADVAVGGNDGINVWVPVDDEVTARARLGRRGIGVRPGSPFHLARVAQHHLRVTSAAVASGAVELAAVLAEAGVPATDPKARNAMMTRFAR